MFMWTGHLRAGRQVSVKQGLFSFFKLERFSSVLNETTQTSHTFTALTHNEESLS